MVELKEIEGFPGYLAGSDGSIHSCRRKKPRILSNRLTRDGRYAQVALRSEAGEFVGKLTHVLICEAFHGKPLPGQQVRHLDGDAGNNRPENLRWGTGKENAQDAVKHGRRGSGSMVWNSAFRGDDLRTIVAMRNLGIGVESIATVFGVTGKAVYTFLSGKTYPGKLDPS